MGTASICFMFSIVSLFAFVLPHLDHPEKEKAFWSAFALVWSLPSLASMFAWFFAGMLFLWLQRIRDAILEVQKTLRERQ
ncbi:MAG: hypothetical protein FD138_3352 [Planctomycetota bacterium]|nr:MAG: hypothetical protein FD138_3352 [Planctomycetota bacterium]